MLSVPAGAASAEQEQAFVDAYKAAAALHPLPSSAPVRRRSMP
jgi:hypothetical protein